MNQGGVVGGLAQGEDRAPEVPSIEEETPGPACLMRRLAEEQRQGRLRADAGAGVAADPLVGLMRDELELRTALGGPNRDEAASSGVMDQTVEVFLRACGLGTP